MTNKITAWAIVNDGAGILWWTISRTRRDAINKFTEIGDGVFDDAALWRSYKRKGYRTSRVLITEVQSHD